MHLLKEGEDDWGIQKVFHGHGDIHDYKGLGYKAIKIIEFVGEVFCFWGLKHMFTFLLEGCFKPSTN
jgi:hypothetical protein